MAEESASGAINTPVALPIVIGVEGSIEFAHGDSPPLRAFFESELAAVRQAYPHSRVWLVPQTSDALLSVLSSAAEASHVRILGRHDRIIDCGLEAGALDLHGGDCHVLIRVLNDTSAVTLSPQPAPLPISLEARYAVELIEVRLDPDRPSLACSVTRRSLTGSAARGPVRRDGSDKALKRTDRFNSDARARANDRTDTVPIRSDIGTATVACAHLQGLFASADALSNAYQAKVTRTIQLIFVLATLATLFSLIPIFGSIMSSFPIVAFALSQGFKTGLAMLLWIIGIHALEAYLLNPKIMGSAARIHPIVVAFALIAGERTFGTIGALFAVPLAAILVGCFEFARLKAQAPAAAP